MFNRKISTKLPDVVDDKETTSDQNVQTKDSEAKQKMKEHADKRAQAQDPEIEIGDTVLVRQKKKNKLSTKFDPSPYKVVEVKGTMVTAVRNEKYITRNISQFKSIRPSVRAPAGDDSDDSDLSDIEETDETPPDPVPLPNIPPPPTRRYPARQRKALR